MKNTISYGIKTHEGLYLIRFTGTYNAFDYC
jgi:hypothetical protein